jgi:hypothetical protein
MKIHSFTLSAFLALVTAATTNAQVPLKGYTKFGDNVCADGQYKFSPQPFSYVVTSNTGLSAGECAATCDTYGEFNGVMKQINSFTLAVGINQCRCNFDNGSTIPESIKDDAVIRFGVGDVEAMVNGDIGEAHCYTRDVSGRFVDT